MQAALTQYILAFMMAVYPIQNHDFTGASPAFTRARYEAIAADIADVALDPDEPSLFHDGRTPGRVKTALLVASVARFESGGYRQDVDELKKLGDGGHAVCLMQLHLWPGERVEDRPSCLRAALRHMRASFEACGSLSGYTVGKCVPDDKAFSREKLAQDWILSHPFPPVSMLH